MANRPGISSDRTWGYKLTRIRIKAAVMVDPVDYGAVAAACSMPARSIDARGHASTPVRAPDSSWGGGWWRGVSGGVNRIRGTAAA